MRVKVMDPARIRLAACRTCQHETQHVDIWCHSRPARTNGGAAAVVVQMLMCLTCWARREP
jgi:hypothetical protein